MHVRRGVAEVAQGGRAELTTTIGGAVGHADEMQFEVGEHWAAVALDATGILEDAQSALLLGIQHVGVALEKTVERSAGGDQGALESRNGLGQMLRRNRFSCRWVECRLE